MKNSVAIAIAIMITLSDLSTAYTSSPPPYLPPTHSLTSTPRRQTLLRYRYHIMDSLRLDKLKHWDPELRRLSALALGGMAPLEPQYAAERVLPAALADALSPRLLRRHGACLALAEVTLALGKVWCGVRGGGGESFGFVRGVQGVGEGSSGRVVGAIFG